MAELNERGHEILDSTPCAVPVQFRPRSYIDQVREMIKREISQAAQVQGAETFEEADDFNVGDDFDPRSPWELTADQEGYQEPSLAPQERQSQAQPGDLSTDPPPKAGAVGKSGLPGDTGTPAGP